MKKMYLFLTAFFVSVGMMAQTVNIDLSQLDPEVTTTFESELVIDVAVAASPALDAKISIENPFLGVNASEIEISFDVYNYDELKNHGALVSFVNIVDAEIVGRMYFNNGSYLGYNFNGYYDVNHPWDPATDFLGQDTWRTIKLNFSPIGYAVYVDDVLAFNTTEGDVSRGGDLTDHDIVMDFFTNVATHFLIGTGSWWSDNINEETGVYWDLQYSYLKNISLSYTESTVVSITDPVFKAKGEVVRVQYFNIAGANVGSEFNALTPGLYIKKVEYSNGVTETTKVVKARR